MAEFILMLTRDDKTVKDAVTIYGDLRHLGLRHVGCKDIGLPADELAALLGTVLGRRTPDPSRGRLRDLRGRRSVRRGPRPSCCRIT